MDVDLTLPLALALAPPVVALALLDVVMNRSQKKATTGLGSLARAIEDGEEEIGEDNENGKLTRGCSLRSLPAGGGSSPATANGGARAGP